MTVEETKKLVCDSGKELLEHGYVSGTWGNISFRIDDTYIAITPSGREYETMTPDEIVIVNYKDHSYEGSIKPSSEFKLHTEIYRTRKNINAVIHTHQMNASTVAAARRDIPPILDDMVQIIGPTVRCADYALPNTKKIVKATVKALKGRYAALMANHGAVCIGRDMKEAFVVCQVLEKACKVFIEAEFIGGAKGITKFEAHLMHQFYLLKYSKQKKKV
ncbi:MAG: class II aldolase/adducin family protein [Cyclobacteriaceae bacterium]|nr:class II aldolase/adducin family protein [Cyclobacteriaceae bacterium]